MLAYVFALLGAVGVYSETSGFDSKPRASFIKKVFHFSGSYYLQRAAMLSILSEPWSAVIIAPKSATLRLRLGNPLLCAGNHRLLIEYPIHTLLLYHSLRPLVEIWRCLLETLDKRRRQQTMLGECLETEHKRPSQSLGRSSRALAYNWKARFEGWVRYLLLQE